MDGKKAYAWLFANDLFKVFAFRETRGSIVPKEILGEEELDIILIVDRYLGYSPLLLFRQFCYAHLLRDVEKLKLEFPDDKQISIFCDDLMTQLDKTLLCAILLYNTINLSQKVHESNRNTWKTNFTLRKTGI